MNIDMDEKKANSIAAGIMLLFVLAACAYSYFHYVSSPAKEKKAAPAPKPVKQTKIVFQGEVDKQCKPVNILVDGGLIKKLDYEVHWYFVDPQLWAAVPYGDKKLTLLALGKCQAAKTGDPDNDFVHIKDYYTGKELAWGDGDFKTRIN